MDPLEPPQEIDFSELDQLLSNMLEPLHIVSIFKSFFRFGQASEEEQHPVPFQPESFPIFLSQFLETMHFKPKASDILRHARCRKLSQFFDESPKFLHPKSKECLLTLLSIVSKADPQEYKNAAKYSTTFSKLCVFLWKTISDNSFGHEQLQFLGLVDQLSLNDTFIQLMLNPGFFSASILINKTHQSNEVLYLHLESLVHKICLNSPKESFDLLHLCFAEIDYKKVSCFPVRFIKKFITELPTLGIRATLQEELEYQTYFEPAGPNKRPRSKRLSLQESTLKQTSGVLSNPHLLSQLSPFVPDLTFLFEGLLDFIAVNYKNRIPTLLKFLESTVSRLKEQEKIFFAHKISERLISLKNPNPRLVQCCLLIMSHVSSSSNFRNLVLLEEVFKVNQVYDYDHYFEYFLTVLDDLVLVRAFVDPKTIWFNEYHDDSDTQVGIPEQQLHPHPIIEGKITEGCEIFDTVCLVQIPIHIDANQKSRIRRPLTLAQKNKK